QGDLAAGEYLVRVLGKGSSRYKLGVTSTAIAQDPTLSIASSSSVTEGNSGTTNLAFTVSLSAPSSKTVTVGYSTANGTATAGSDFTGISSALLSFSPGQTTKTISIPVIGDTQVEGNETFSVNLSNPTNASIASGKAIGTITDDDTPTANLPALSIGNASIVEGDAGAQNLAFTVNLSAASAQAVTVNYATADGSAIGGSDYTPTVGTLTFAAGQTSQIINVPISGDEVLEPDETFSLTLTNPANATIATAQATGTIVNNDIAGSSFGTAIDLTNADLATKTLTGAISDADKQDYYKVNLAQTGDLVFTATGLQGKADVEFYDSNRNKLQAPSFSSNAAYTQQEKFLRSLATGDYFIRVVQKTAGQSANYTLTSKRVTDQITNTAPTSDTLTNVSQVPTFDKYVKGSTDADYYRFTVTGRSFLNVELTNLFGNLDVLLGEAGTNENTWAVFNSDSASPAGTSNDQGVEKFGGTLNIGSYIIKVIAPNEGSTYDLAMTLTPRTTQPSITRDINYGTEGSQAKVLGTLNGLTYFSAFDGTKTTLFSTDGTLDGTTQFQSKTFSTISGSSVVSSDGLYFVASDGSTGDELWKLSTNGNINLVADLGTGGLGGDIANLTAVGNTVYFRGALPDAASPNNPALFKRRLYKTTGTGATDITGTLKMDQVGLLTPFGSEALFFRGADVGTGDVELYYILNNDPNNTLNVINLHSSQSSTPSNLTKVGNDTLYLTANVQGNGGLNALVKIQATRSGGTLTGFNPVGGTPIGGTDYGDIVNSATIKTIGGTDYSSFSVSPTTKMALFDNGTLNDTTDDVLYFTANFRVGTSGSGAQQGVQLMRLNNPVAATATSAATDFAVVRDSAFDPAIGANPDQLTVFNGRLYFFADDVTTRRLWVSNGTSAGTTLVTGLTNTTVYSASNPILSGKLTAVGNSLFFPAQDSTNGVELWRITTTTPTPALVQDINLGTGNADPDQFITASGGIFFIADDGTSGQELWFVGGS
ncbi:MAG TPA: Calx-beta domain-containing protein, partial [Allocoleopsis sp.]